MDGVKIVLAPDGFKGSLSAVEACAAIERGIRRVPGEFEVRAIPLADGGEGTLHALLLGLGGVVKISQVQGPLGQTVQAQWGILPDGKAIIEMAQASGLVLVGHHERDAGSASSFGTGQLIKAALDAGCREIVLGLGGSATSDGGMGVLAALGLMLRDERQRALPLGGAYLENLDSIDARFLDERLAKTKFTVLRDVSNPLHGPDGAAHVYGSQKGASPSQIEQIDRGLQRLADAVAKSQGKDLRNCPGAGAAGGIGFGLMSFCQATLESGIDFVLAANDFAAAIENADLILTGEGALDDQTLNGKTIVGVCRVARTRNVPVIALGGMVRLTGTQMDALGLTSAFALADGPRSLEDCIAHAPELLATVAERVVRTVQLSL